VHEPVNEQPTPVPAEQLVPSMPGFALLQLGALHPPAQVQPPPATPAHVPDDAVGVLFTAWQAPVESHPFADAPPTAYVQPPGAAQLTCDVSLSVQAPVLAHPPFHAQPPAPVQSV